MKELQFSSIENALQYLADFTDKRIVVEQDIKKTAGKILIAKAAKKDKPLKIDWFDSGADMEISLMRSAGDVGGSIWREYPDKHKDDWTVRLPGKKNNTSGTLAYCLEKVMDSGQDLMLKVHPRITKAENKEEEGADVTGHPKSEIEPLEFEFDIEDSELLSKTRTPTTTAPPSVGGLRRVPI